jgi:hypothetical protein
VTLLSLTRPLAGILDACRDAGRPLSQRDLGERRSPRVSQAAVYDAVRVGDGIALANLAAYARAAGLRLWVGTASGEHGPNARLWDVTADARAAGVGVGPLRDALAGLGLEMVLTVEDDHGADRH